MHNGQRSLWDILGTEPTGDERALKREYATGDERALKRAYAKRLKVTRPEDDPAAFQELREAYEYALRHAHLFAAELPEPQSAGAEAEAAEVPEAAPMEPADLWGVIDDAAQEPPAELWGIIAREPAPPPELWGVVAIDPTQEAANLWQGCLAQTRHADASDVLARMLQDDAMLNLDVREEFDLCALRYCAGAGYDLALRQALFEQLGWDRDFSYLARSHADLVRSAVQRYRADRSFAHFSDNRDSYPGLDCLMSQQPPSAYARQLFDRKFTLQLRELLHAIRWQHAEMLACKLDTDLFEQWEHAVHAKRYFKQTALASGGLGFVLHFMLAGVLDAAGFKLGDTAAYASLLGFQALAFALLAMHALRWPAPLFARLDTLQEALQERLPVLWQRPGLRQLGWIVPYLVLALLLFLPERSETMRLVTAAGLCASALLAYALNRQLLHGMLLLLCLGLSLFVAMFMSGKGQPALAIGDAMPIDVLPGGAGPAQRYRPVWRLRLARGALAPPARGMAGRLCGLAVATVCAAVASPPRRRRAVCLVVRRLAVFPSDFKWKTIWPLVLVPSIASFVLAGQAPFHPRHADDA